MLLAVFLYNNIKDVHGLFCKSCTEPQSETLCLMIMRPHDRFCMDDMNLASMPPYVNIVLLACPHAEEIGLVKISLI